MAGGLDESSKRDGNLEYNLEEGKDNEDATPGCCSLVGNFFRSITIEPVAVFSILGMATQTVLTNEYIVGFYYSLYMRDGPNSTKSPLAQDAAAADSAAFISTLQLCNIPSIFTAFFLGIYSDRVGRKPVLFIPLFGQFISACIVFCIIQFTLDLNWFFLPLIILDLCGGSTVLQTLVFAYITDITTSDNVSIRMLYIRMIEIGAVSISSLVTGILVTYVGFIYAQLFVLFTFFIALSYTTCFLKRTDPPKHEARSLFDIIAGVKQLYELTTSGGFMRRFTLGVYSYLLFVDAMYSTGGMVMLTIFLYNPPVDLGADWVGYYFTEYCLLRIVGTLMLVPFYKGNKSDWCWLLLGLCSGLLAKLLMSVPYYEVAYVFFVPWVGFLTIIIVPFSRAFLTHLVAADEQGAMSAWASMVCQIATIIGSSLLTYIYSVTYDYYVPSVFCIGSFAYASGIILLVILMCVRRQRPGDNSQPLEDHHTPEPSTSSTTLSPDGQPQYGTHSHQS